MFLDRLHSLGISAGMGEQIDDFERRCLLLRYRDLNLARPLVFRRQRTVESALFRNSWRGQRTLASATTLGISTCTSCTVYHLPFDALVLRLSASGIDSVTAGDGIECRDVGSGLGMAVHRIHAVPVVVVAARQSL